MARNVFFVAETESTLTFELSIGCYDSTHSLVLVAGRFRIVKGKIFLTLFALPFLAVGVWMLYAMGSELHDSWRMQDWQAVPATLSRAGVESRQGEDSTTYVAFASYEYNFRGQRYRGERVGLSSGADNIGSYQADTGRRLEAAWRAGESVTVFVNPEAPSESIVDRELRWSMLAFRSIFVLLFGGFGLGMSVFAIRSKPAADADDPRFANAPWLANDSWQTATLRSSSKASMYAAWGFAAFWNLISIPLPFLMFRELTEKQNYAALLALLFPAVGIGLLVWALRRSREWYRFGATPLTLDPFPGSIGGHVGGTMELSMPYDPLLEINVSLTSLQSYVSGSGKNRSRREKALWQDSQLAKLSSAQNGTRLTCRFNVPESLRESDAVRGGGTYHLWRLNVSSQLAGADLNRDFDIPVYATAALSAQITDRQFDAAARQNDVLAEQSARDKIKFSYAGMGKSIVYSAGRHLGGSIGASLVGAIFAGVGWFLLTAESERFIGSVFLFLGSLVGLGGLYMGLNSLQVSSSAGRLHTVRRILGIPVSRRSMRLDQIARVYKDSGMQTQSGGKHVMYYSVYAKDIGGKKLCLGEGFTGDSEAEAAIRLISRELSISPRASVRHDASADAYDPLAADQ